MKFATTLIFLLVTILAYSQPPSADFSASPLEVCIGDPINFTDLSVAGASPLNTRVWDFGDGNSSTLTNPSHTYTTAGSYTITLVVTALNGQSDAEVKVVYVTVHPLPIVGFTTSGNGCTVPFDVTFTNTSDTGAGINYAWDFGNTQTSTLENPAPVTYGSAGTFTVTLIVTNTITGCVNTTTQDLVVSDYTAEFTMPASGCVGDLIQFTDASTVGTNTWSWDFGDTGTSGSQNPTHAYSAPGVYTVTLNAGNSVSGCADGVTHDITINPLPVPSFTADITTGCAPLVVTFTNTSGAGVTFDWDFGNGSTFSGPNPPSQSYTADGSYTVSLSMTDANGCVGIITMPALIVVSAPIVQFTMDQYNGCEPVTVTFTDGSIEPDPIGDPIVTWLWDFGDGSPISSGEVPPPHVYNEGVYSVTLTVVTANGCQATITYTDTIQIGSILNVDFSIAPVIECAKTPIDFIDLTTFNGTPGPGEVSYNWDFGDGGTSTQQSPTYMYPTDTGYFDVQLIVEWRGCIDTLIVPQAVYIMAPISIFTPDNLLFCNPGSLPITVNITDQAILGTIPDDVFMTYSWGDGTFTNFDDPVLDGPTQGNTSHDYNAYGTYVIQQAVYNSTTGCSDSTQQTIHVSWVTADFTLSNDSTCVGDPITLTSTSATAPMHPFGTFSYDMGDGGSTSGNPATYTYNTFGAYDVVLTATNSVGCSDNSTFIGMDALALPQAGITASDIAGCAPITVTYDNSSAVVGNGVPLSSFLWTFPDLSTQVTSNVATSTNYTYNTQGTFTTTLVVTDQFGCVSPLTSVNMTITKPTAAFTMPAVVCDLEAFIALNGSTGATSYEWFVDGSSSSFATDYATSFDEVTNPPANSVTHNFELITTDANGCMDTVNQDIVVSMPYADISYTLTGASVNGAGEFTCPPVFASFTDNSSSYGNITNWNWDFGDGKFSTLQDPNNTYVFSGIYSAGLTIVDEFGCTADTLLFEFLEIFGPSGDPDWTSLGDVCGQSFIFDVTNLNNVDNISWNMGDGNIINSLTGFQYNYESFETFNPTATLSDSLGCEIIYALPPIFIANNGLEAAFTALPPEGPMGTQFEINQNSTFTSSPIVTWTWYFLGDTVVNLNGADFSSDFGLPGTYEITLVVADANGCLDTYTTSIIVTNDFHPPNVFTPNGDGANDFFSLSAPIFKSFDIVILNRWGNVVHERQNATGIQLWDGLTPNGTLVNDGVYFYKLVGILVDDTAAEKHGNVSVFSGPQ